MRKTQPNDTTKKVSATPTPGLKYRNLEEDLAQETKEIVNNIY